MSPALTPATHRVSFAISDEHAAKRVADDVATIRTSAYPTDSRLAIVP